MAGEPVELNVRAAIVITRELPGTSTINASATISWQGSRFHVHAESGLPVDDLLALATSPRGLGPEPRTIEDFMDTWNALSIVTEVYGDRTAPLGTVVENGTTLEVSTERLAPLAELVLSGDVTGLKATGSRRLLDRDATEYTTSLSGPDGARSTVRRLVSGPYTLLREVTDDYDSGARLRVEVSSLSEGTVQDVSTGG